MCIFCDLYREKKNIIHENELFFSIYDNYPVNKGHVLIIPKRHIESYFELSSHEKRLLDDELCEMKNLIDSNYTPDGYNIGINIGRTAGQTIFHLHVHLIPRYVGDIENPQGGVRGVIPSKQKY